MQNGISLCLPIEREAFFTWDLGLLTWCSDRFRIGKSACLYKVYKQKKPEYLAKYLWHNTQNYVEFSKWEQGDGQFVTQY